MTARPTILLDRDGTMIVERDYLSDPAQVALERGAVDGLARLQRAGWPLVVLTNQSGVGRGLFPITAVDAVNAGAGDLLGAAGITIAGWYVCPHAPGDGCACRKPAPGMALQAAHEIRLDLSRSWMIGDKPADLALGDAIGAPSILVRTGHGNVHANLAQAQGRIVQADLAAAVDVVLEHTAAASRSPTATVAS